MFRLFKAIGRYIGAFFALFTGGVDAARKRLSKNAAVIGVEYDTVIKDKRDRIQTIKRAVGTKASILEKKRLQLEDETKEVIELEKGMQGAQVVASQILKDRFAGDMERARGDFEFMDAKAHFADYRSSKQEKEELCTALEQDITAAESEVKDWEIQLKILTRELDKLREEKVDTQADMEMAKEAEEAADLISGIADDRSGERLQELRQMRREATATAKVAQRVAGTDHKVSDEKFKAAAVHAAADDEFEALLMGTQRESQDHSVPITTKVPER